MTDLAEDLLGLIRTIVREELATRPGLALGVVERTAPGGPDDDQANYSVDVRLSGDWVLEAVPVTVQLPGLAALPPVGTCVLVGFLGAGADRPVVLGSAYDADNRPPEPLKKGWLFEVAGTRFEMTKGGLTVVGENGPSVVIASGKQSTTVSPRKIVGK